MLLELSISDFAIFEQATLQFSDGLNVLTGETGAGKSILLDALGAVLGARVSTDLVRTGSRSALVEAAFSPADRDLGRLQDVATGFGVDLSPDESLILSREILASGRSIARVNGRLLTAGALASIGSVLVDIHGQSDHLAILRTSEQLNLLDRFAGTGPLRNSIGELVRAWRETGNALSELGKGERERAQRVDLLRYQIEEIDAIGPTPGEDGALVQERDLLRSADRLETDARAAFALLSGDDGDVEGVVAGLREVLGLTREIAALDARSETFLERANDLLVLSEDLMRELRDYADSLESDEQRLQMVEDRIDGLNTLKRKYGESLEAVIAYRDQAELELEYLNSGSFDAETLRQELVRQADDISHKGQKLSNARTSSASELGKRIELAIADLNMGNAEVRVEVSQRDDANGIDLPPADRRVHVDETGLDHVQFLIAPNRGEALKPLARIASGGETARLMLAIKSILSEADLTPTLVFDEIDVGVGGRSGQVVGEKLRDIATKHQVVVVTHLPQIAAFAETHLKIEKHERSGRTISTVKSLDSHGREVELAAMLDGTPVSAASLTNARAMIARVAQQAH
ncbi:MAG TPA: DNA repair protein RecN [Thermomicrobiales bacterium]|nr:DNA repair protein RecN [Thermomicrobiales bacterium]